MTGAKCLSDDTIAALLESRLSGAPLSEAYVHLADCASCRALWTTAAQTQSQSVAEPNASSLPDEGVEPIEAPATLLARGTNVGRLVVLGVVGSGGMSVVYSAYD